MATSAIAADASPDSSSIGAFLMLTLNWAAALASAASFMACWMGSIDVDGSEKPSSSLGGSDNAVGAVGISGSGRAE